MGEKFEHGLFVQGHNVTDYLLLESAQIYTEILVFH